MYDLRLGHHIASGNHNNIIRNNSHIVCKKLNIHKIIGQKIQSQIQQGDADLLKTVK